ncbi:hypothetical protein R70331_04585 [Paenibacillus sp. FSL R7-0331]|nr:hypothetical protein R70331_04585 [Paenibacillus sp. FSL R7-0331]
MRLLNITNTNLVTLLSNNMITGGKNTDCMIITHINLVENTASNAVTFSHGFISGICIVK